MTEITEYRDGLVMLSDQPDPIRCPTCHELRPDMSMPCEWCGEVE